MSGYILRERAPLEARNTFRVAATAALFADVRTTAGLRELFDYPYLRSQPVLVLGEGSNLLFAADVPGVVVSLVLPGIEVLHDDGDVARVRVNAGERWDDLVRWSVGRGFSGLENLALIPGSVGACPIQNIGAYGTEVAEFIASVDAYDRTTGAMTTLSNAECAFGYRDSVFKRAPERWVIAAVEFLLPRRRALRLDYAGVREELAKMGAADAPRPPHVAEAISRLRTEKLPNPALIGNAGSFFKNPTVPRAVADALHVDFPALPRYPAGSDEAVKLSAAWMIEQCGWKGFREGDAGVAAQHALVLVNHGHATGAQLLDLARRIAVSVQMRFGVALEPEPRIIGAVW